MYRATTNELKRFKKIVGSDQICTALVSEFDPERGDYGASEANEDTFYKVTNDESDKMLAYKVTYFKDF
jgi:hypothetical protein